MGWMARTAARMAALLGISAYTVAPGIPGPSREAETRMRKAYGGLIAPLPQTKLRWYRRDLESATYDADGGDLSSAASLYSAIRSDGTFAGVIGTRTAGLVRLPRQFHGDPEMIDALQLGGDSVRSVFDEMFPPAELELFAADGIMLGVAVGELVPVEGRDYPVFVRLEPEFLRYRFQDNRWYYQSLAGLLPITPGDGRWVLHVPGGRVAPWRNGAWRACGKAWIRKEHADLHKDNWEAKLANPARVAVSPQGAGEAQKQSWFQSVMAWGVNTVFGVTPGYDVKLLESNGRGYESFDSSMDRSDRETVIAIAGQVVTTGGGAGFINGDLFKSIRADIIQRDAEGLAYTLNTQGLPGFVLARWGEEGLDRMAVVKYDARPAKEQNSEAASLTAVGGAIKSLDEALANHGVKLDVARLCTRFGVPIEGDADGDGQPDAANATELPLQSEAA